MDRESISDGSNRMHRLLRQIADEGVELRISGDCMRPFLRDGDRVHVVRTRLWWPGDVIVFRDHIGRMVSHRLLGIYRRNGRWKLLTQADSAQRPDRGVSPEQVLGKAIEVPVTLSHRIWAISRFLRFTFIDRHRARAPS